MKDIRQIRLIGTALTKEKEKFLRELAKVTASIEKKMATINKMIAYQKEYHNTQTLQLSRTLPSLNRNLNDFSKKILDVIKQAESDLANMQSLKDALMQSIGKVDDKIKLMNMFENKVNAEAQYQAEKAEQSTLDELASVKHIRGDHE